LATCPICRSVDIRDLGIANGYPFALCASCGHSFTARVPTEDELRAIYDEYSYRPETLETMPPVIVRRNQEIVATFAPWRRSGRLLDVGFGAGIVLKVAADLGWQTFGIEVSRAAVELARKHALGAVFEGELAGARFEPESFDVIVMSELLEHLVDPRPTLRAAARFLAPGGLLYLTTPHGRGVSGRLLNVTWSVCSPPEHIHLFSRPSLERVLRETGLRADHLATNVIYPQELLHWARSRLPRGRRERVTPNARVEASYRTNAALTGSRWGRAAKTVVNRVLTATTLGDSLVVHASRA